MSSQSNRHIAFTIENQTYLVPAHATLQNDDGTVKVTFEFNTKTAPLDVQFVTAFNDFDRVVMTTERGTEFSKGPLFDQLIEWFNDLMPQRDKS